MAYPPGCLPQGRHANEARAHLAASAEADRRADAAAWREAQWFDTSDAYQAYLTRLPQGAHAEDARRRIAEAGNFARSLPKEQTGSDTKDQFVGDIERVLRTAKCSVGGRDYASGYTLSDPDHPEARTTDEVLRLYTLQGSNVIGVQVAKWERLNPSAIVQNGSVIIQCQGNYSCVDTWSAGYRTDRNYHVLTVNMRLCLDDSAAAAWIGSAMSSWIRFHQTR